VRDLDAQGFQIGCHSMTHLDLSDLTESELKREVADAKLQHGYARYFRFPCFPPHFSDPFRSNQIVGDCLPRACFRLLRQNTGGH
jgi:peptidoglycan/xylan/chitin deacetylase (PgdA/CDA1 family)